MATPSKKSESMESALKKIFGFDRRESIEKDICTMCKGSATEFRNSISRKEYSISGMCQKCQDSIFGVD